MINFIKKFNFRYRFFKKLAKRQRILELGCGGGINLEMLHSLNPDLDLHAVDWKRFDELGSYVKFVQSDLDREPLPYPDESFDAILLVHVIEHLQHPLKLAEELSRVLKPGGCVYVEAPNWVSLFVPSFGIKRKQQGPFNFFDDPTHKKPWSRHGVFAYLSQFAGLKGVRVGVTRNWVRLPLDPLIILIGLILGRRDWLVTSVANLVGWCVYGYGFKPEGGSI